MVCWLHRDRSRQGLIKGYPDGTFKPANQVSYAEAITMLVRALGYKDEFLSGQWPANYLAKAGEKKSPKSQICRCLWLCKQGRRCHHGQQYPRCQGC